MLTSINIITVNEPQNKNLQDEVSDAARQQFSHDWETKLNRVHAKRGHGLNKLRTSKLFKHEYGTDSYVDKVYQTGQRSAMARFRCGIAPINIELGLYVNVPADQRFCHFCDNCIEDEDRKYQRKAFLCICQRSDAKYITFMCKPVSVCFY